MKNKILLLVGLLFVFGYLGLKIFPGMQEKIRQASIAKLKKDSLDYEKQNNLSSSDIPLDILIPVIEKDLSTLPLVVKYARLNVRHPINDVYIVGPKEEKIQDFCSSNSCQFVDEAKILPISVEDVDYIPKGRDRRGWLFQQFLKLSADKICSSDHILILDADTLLVRPQIFIHEDKILLNCSEEFYTPYFEMYKKLLLEKTKSDFSFVCHHMLFEKSKLLEIRGAIETIHDMPWYEAIQKLISKRIPSGFSEYETYGNFCLDCYPKKVVQLHWMNLNLPREDLQDFIDGKIQIDPTIKSVSFHSYN